ncbi:hypothetical protein FOA52_005918 [Chlamydomonas sp. UWO 241]|nr:hypothetical protein FOA52_005918 [Chlamydomonas sp. UWO 241]
MTVYSIFDAHWNATATAVLRASLLDSASATDARSEQQLKAPVRAVLTGSHHAESKSHAAAARPETVQMVVPPLKEWLPEHKEYFALLISEGISNPGIVRMMQERSPHVFTGLTADHLDAIKNSLPWQKILGDALNELPKVPGEDQGRLKKWRVLNDKAKFVIKWDKQHPEMVSLVARQWPLKLLAEGVGAATAGDTFKGNKNGACDTVARVCADADGSNQSGAGSSSDSAKPPLPRAPLPRPRALVRMVPVSKATPPEALELECSETRVPESEALADALAKALAELARATAHIDDFASQQVAYEMQIAALSGDQDLEEFARLTEQIALQSEEIKHLTQDNNLLDDLFGEPDQGVTITGLQIRVTDLMIELEAMEVAAEAAQQKVQVLAAANKTAMEQALAEAAAHAASVKEAAEGMLQFNEIMSEAYQDAKIIEQQKIVDGQRMVIDDQEGFIDGQQAHIWNQQDHIRKQNRLIVNLGQAFNDQAVALQHANDDNLLQEHIDFHEQQAVSAGASAASPSSYGSEAESAGYSHSE